MEKSKSYFRESRLLGNDDSYLGSSFSFRKGASLFLELKLSL